jgi:hypothetical protein
MGGEFAAFEEARAIRPDHRLAMRVIGRDFTRNLGTEEARQSVKAWEGLLKHAEDEPRKAQEVDEGCALRPPWRMVGLDGIR